MRFNLGAHSSGLDGFGWTRAKRVETKPLTPDYNTWAEVELLTVSSFCRLTGVPALSIAYVSTSPERTGGGTKNKVNKQGHNNKGAYLRVAWPFFLSFICFYS